MVDEQDCDLAFYFYYLNFEIYVPYFEVKTSSIKITSNYLLIKIWS